MSTSVHPNSHLGLYAIVAAAAAVLTAPLLAVAYFATAQGAEYLEVATVAAWATPARKLFGGLVTFASPDRVYATYTQVMALLFPAILFTALATRSQRPAPTKRSEQVGWPIALAGYSLFALGLAAVAVLLVPGDTSAGLVDGVFLALLIPGMLLSIIGSTVLGIAFLRSGYRPKLTAWLLALSFPLLILGSVVLGHNSLGVAPLFLAWATTGRRWRQTPATPMPAGNNQVLARPAHTMLGLLTALVTVMLVAAGCGDAGEDTADEADTTVRTVPKDEAVARVTQRCAQVNKAFENIEFQEEPGRVADELEAFAADVRAMPPPDEDQEVFESLIAGLEDSAATWQEAADAPEGQQERAIGAAYDSFEPAEQAAVELGVGPLQDCGREAVDADPDAERVDVTAREYDFDLPETVPTGPVAFVLDNQGEEPHHMTVVRFTGDETVEDLFAAEQAGENPDEYVEDVGDSPAAAPGEKTVLNADLSPGRYAMLCFISAPDGEPHALKGMHAEFTVQDD